MLERKGREFANHSASRNLAKDSAKSRQHGLFFSGACVRVAAQVKFVMPTSPRRANTLAYVGKKFATKVSDLQEPLHGKHAR